MNDASSKSLLLRKVRLTLPNSVADNSNLLIEGDRIAAIQINHSTQSSVADQELDLSSLTLFPGFIDAHIHGAAGIDTMDASADDLQRVAAFLARNGVTAWLPTLVPSPVEQYQQAVRTIGKVMAAESGDPGQASEYRLQSRSSAEGKSPTEVGTLNKASARILGVHYEGPFVNTEQCGALHREFFRTFRSPEDLNSLPTLKQRHAVHMLTLAPEISGGVELIKELRKRNWIVSIGHTRADASTLDEARNAGAHHMTHFMNAMTPLHHRSLGAVGWGFIHDDVTIDVIADGIHIDPEILKLIVHSKTTKNVSLISDAIAAAGQGDGVYRIWGEEIAVKNGRTENARGSIAGSAITMLDAVRMMLLLGFGESEVARMSSLNPARLLGMDQDCGSIEAGKRADLVAIDEKRQVRLTIIGGEVAFQDLP